MNDVQVNYTLTIPQVELILESLGNMPFSRVDQLIHGMREIALNALNDARNAAPVVEIPEVEPKQG